MSELSEQTVWYGNYKNIIFEIRRFPASKELDPDKEYCWCHYITIWISQFPKEMHKELRPKVYYTQFGTRIESHNWDGKLANIHFHGGCTYYRVEHRTETDTLLKVGCDYQHYWDMHKEYSLKYVLSEVKKTIDDLWLTFPELKTYEQVNEEFRSRFPGENNPSDHRMFNHLGEKIDE